jgi:hypothetical protein
MVYDALTSILQELFGGHGQQPGNALGLRLVLLGSPELSVQGEILHRLRKCGFNAAIECGVGTRKRRLDLVVFDDGWRPLAAIELKHRMSNQGPITQLVSGLDADRTSFLGCTASAVPFIQLGLFTEVHHVADHTDGGHGLYRVLSSPSYGLLKRHKPPKHNLDNQSEKLTKRDFLVAPLRSTLRIGDVTITGRVGYVLRAPHWQSSPL